MARPQSLSTFDPANASPRKLHLIEWVDRRFDFDLAFINYGFI